jgi:hypothetical protein
MQPLRGDDGIALNGERDRGGDEGATEPTQRGRISTPFEGLFYLCMSGPARERCQRQRCPAGSCKKLGVEGVLGISEDVYILRRGE